MTNTYTVYVNDFNRKFQETVTAASAQDAVVEVAKRAGMRHGYQRGLPQGHMTKKNQDDALEQVRDNAYYTTAQGRFGVSACRAGYEEAYAA